MSQITILRNYLDPNLGADCKFLVGSDFGDIEEICGHKAIFANASTVFKNMFFGSIPEEGEIKIPEIHPETFRTMMNAFYAGTITIVSVEQAIELWYVVNKYNIEDLIKFIPDYLIENITPQNVLCILRYSMLYSNEIVKEKCHEIIKVETLKLLSDSSFLEADLSTLSFILDQDDLNASEIDLFRALVRYDNARKNNTDNGKSLQPPPTSPAKSVSGDVEVKNASVSHENDIDSNGDGEGSTNRNSSKTPGEIEAIGRNPVKELLKYIRFLTMTPEEFAECVGMSSLISTSEAFNIVVNISTPHVQTLPMPEGYSTIKEKRNIRTRIYYGIHVSDEYSPLEEVTEPLAFSLLFWINPKIKIIGVQVNYPMVYGNGFQTNGKFNHTIEILRHNDDVKLLSQNVTRFQTNSFEEILFDEPLWIAPSTWFIIRFTLKNMELGGQCKYYRCRKCYSSEFSVNSVQFKFDCNPTACKCKGFIKSIIFTTCE